MPKALRFSSRSLFLAVTIVCVGAGFYSIRSQQRSDQLQLANALKRLCENTASTYGYAVTRGDSADYVTESWKEWTTGRFRSLEIIAVNVDGPTAATSQDDFQKMLELVCRCHNLEDITFTYTRLSDEHICEIASQCRQLEQIDIRGTSITEQGLRCLSVLANLRYLDASETQASGIGIDARSNNLQWSSLTTLLLEDSKLDDEGLVSIGEVKSLSVLRVAGCEITGAGVLGLASGKCESLTLVDFSRIPEVRFSWNQPKVQDGIQKLNSRYRHITIFR